MSTASVQASTSEKPVRDFDEIMAELRAFSETVVAKSKHATGEPLPGEFECVMCVIMQDPYSPLRFIREYHILRSVTNPQEFFHNICQSRCAELDLKTGRWVIMIGDC